MRRLLLACLLLSLPAWAGTWTFVQGKRSSNCTTSSATCSVTFSAGVGGGTGNVVAVFSGASVNASSTILSATIGTDNFTLVAASACANHPASTSFASDCAYIINPTAAGTVVSVTLSAVPSAAWNILAVELQDNTAAAFDSANNAGQPSTSTSAPGPALTLAGSGEALLQGMRGGNPTSIDTGYTNAMSAFAATGDVAYLINTSTGTAPVWTQSSSKASLNGIAFKDAGGGATVCKSCDLSSVVPLVVGVN